MSTRMGPNWIDRALLQIAPSRAAGRLKARAVAETYLRHYEAASIGRRTGGWSKTGADANAAGGPALWSLRSTSRDLQRNNPWARKGLDVIANNVVSYGFKYKAVNAGNARNLVKAQLAFKAWAAGDCDAAGKLNFDGLCKAVMRAMAGDGEVLLRRRYRRSTSGLALPIQLQMLEADFIDTAKEGTKGVGTGNQVIQGVEYDTNGAVVAYWLFDKHPGSNVIGKTYGLTSNRVPAEDIIHVMRPDRPGQVRGVTWFAPVILRLKDFDEYEDATLLRQKIAACFAGFVTDVQGTPTPIGKTGGKTPGKGELQIEEIEPGMLTYLNGGQDVKFADPPAVSEFDQYSKSILRAIAAGLGITYEQLTGDYSNVNFSSGRMGRLEFQHNVEAWRWDILIPQFCDRVWQWAMEAALLAGKVTETPGVEWTAPPLPMLEPDKEGLAYQRAVRSGMITPDEMVKEQGKDPETHWPEYAANVKKLAAMGIILDSDASVTTQAGNPRQNAAQGAQNAPKKAKTAGKEPAAKQ